MIKHHVCSPIIKLKTEGASISETGVCFWDEFCTSTEEADGFRVVCFNFVSS